MYPNTNFRAVLPHSWETDPFDAEADGEDGAGHCPGIERQQRYPEVLWPPLRNSYPELHAMTMAPDYAYLEFPPDSPEAQFLQGFQVDLDNVQLRKLNEKLLGIGKFSALDWVMLKGSASFECARLLHFDRLVEWLSSNPPVKELKFTLASCSGHQMGQLAPALGALDDLYLLSFQMMIMDEGCMPLFIQGLASHAGLEHLNLSRCRLKDADLALLAPAINGFAKLKTLVLSANYLPDGQGAAALFNALASNSTIQYLNLGLNKFGSQALAALAEMLGTNLSLLELQLRENYFDAAAARILAAGLANNKALLSLDVASNEAADGIVDIVLACRHHPSLTTLRLGKNALTRVHLAPLGKALADNHVLEYVTLEWQFIDGLEDRDLVAMAEDLRANESLQGMTLHTAKLALLSNFLRGDESARQREAAMQVLAQIFKQNAVRAPLRKIAAYLDLHTGGTGSGASDANILIAGHYRLAADAKAFNVIHEMMS